MKYNLFIGCTPLGIVVLTSQLDWRDFDRLSGIDKIDKISLVKDKF